MGIGEHAAHGGRTLLEIKRPRHRLAARAGWPTPVHPHGARVCSQISGPVVR